MRLANSLGQGMRRILDRVFGAQSIHFYRLLGVTLLLLLFGLMMVLSSSSVDSLKSSGNSYAIFTHQLGSAGIGLLGMILLSVIPVAFYYRFAAVPFVILLALQLLLTTTSLGVSVNGNKNWLRIGTQTIQPSEFLKLLMILVIAQWMARNIAQIHNPKYFTVPVMGIGVLTVISVILGNDLGTSIVLVIILFGAVYLAGAPRRLLVAIAIGVTLVGSAFLTTGTRFERIMVWLFPGSAEDSPFTWQSLHAMWAFAAGGIFGSGLGKSRLKWSWIPEAENDFIFAIIGEEWGLLGSIMVVGFFILLAFSMVQIMQRTETDFGRFVAGGIAVWITFQALINIMVVLRLLPVLGVPLPLISDGGSSLFASLAAIGVLLSIERDNYAAEKIAGQRQPKAKLVRR